MSTMTTAAAAAALVAGAMLVSAGAQAQACRETSHIPGLDPLTLRHASGGTLSLKRGVSAGQPTVHVWINGRYAGQHGAPVALFGGAVQVRLRSQLRLETWLGSVRQAYKPTPYLVVCGRDWSGV